MRTVCIPHTDLAPSALCLGSGDFGGSIRPETAHAILDTFVERGGTFIDTASVYNDWIPGERSRSEKLIGAWMKARRNRDRLVVATKGAHPALEHMDVPRMSPGEIAADLDASLRNLQVERIDVYYLHRDDPARPVEEIIETLNAQAQAGKIRCYGCSNWSVERLRAAQEYAISRGIAGFTAVQNLWNLAKYNQGGIPDPTIVVMDDALWQYHRETNLAAVPFTSQANGLFQKLEDGRIKITPGQVEGAYINSGTARRYQRLLALRQQTGLTTTQIVLGYLMGQPFPTIPVIGPRDVRQLEDSLRAADVRLAEDQVQFLLS